MNAIICLIALSLHIIFGLRVIMLSIVNSRKMTLKNFEMLRDFSVVACISIIISFALYYFTMSGFSFSLNFIFPNFVYPILAIPLWLLLSIHYYRIVKESRNNI